MVRARAALESGRLELSQAVPGLVKACADDEPLVRTEAMHALDRLAAVPAAGAGLREAAPKLAAQLMQEQGKRRFSQVDEDLRRVSFKLSRL
jgi:HEAT repeat protein